jgi:non-ribosomal peptide synthetase component E (peptide arylation enzyme)
VCYLEPDFFLLESLFLFDSNNKPREETNILQLNTINEVIKVFFVLLKDGKFDVLVRYW